MKRFPRACELGGALLLGRVRCDDLPYRKGLEVIVKFMEPFRQ